MSVKDTDRGSTGGYFLAGGEHFHLAGVARIWNIDELPVVSCLLIGPKWRRHFNVEQRPIASVNPPWAPLCREGRRFVSVFTLEEDVRERVVFQGEELRPGVFAMWSDAS